MSNPCYVANVGATSPERNGRGPFLPVLLPWLAVAFVDCAVVSTAFVQPAPRQFALEIALLIGMAWGQWTFGRGWLRSPLLAAIVAGVFGVLPHAPAGAPHAGPFVAGIVLPAVLFLRWSRAKLRVPVFAAVLASIAVVLAIHWIDLRAQSSSTWEGHRARVPPSAVQAAAPSGPPIVVISIDTLRADSAQSMESIRRLAARGALWPRAMSTSSWTLPALASLQTGLMPAEHGAACLEDGHCQGLAETIHTLAEDLRAAGRRTAAVVANPWAGAGMGFDRGFDEFVDPGQPGKRLLFGGAPEGPHGQDDARTVDAALDWLQDAPAEGYYLWVHLMGPHMPYTHSTSEKMRRLDVVTLRSSYPSSASQKKEIRDSYDAEVRYTDAQVLRLLDALESRGVLATGTLVLTADHGEEFWDHGGIEHGHSHHAEITDIPLLLVSPGVSSGPRDGVASLVDVAPTLRAIAGSASGTTDLRRGVATDRISTAWGGLILRLDCSARMTSARLIAQDCSPELSAMQLYDLGADPLEQSPSHPSEDNPLVAAVRRIVPPAPSGRGEVASDRLRALGYLQ